MALELYPPPVPAFMCFCFLRQGRNTCPHPLSSGYTAMTARAQDKLKKHFDRNLQFQASRYPQAGRRGFRLEVAPANSRIPFMVDPKCSSDAQRGEGAQSGVNYKHDIMR